MRFCVELNLSDAYLKVKYNQQTGPFAHAPHKYSTLQKWVLYELNEENKQIKIMYIIGFIIDHRSKEQK